MKIVLVGCSGQKRSSRAPARQLYTGALFRRARTYAEQVGDVWYILSAEHMLLHPARMTFPYDRKLAEVDQQLYVMSVIAHLQAAHILQGTEVIILAGIAYRKNLIPTLEAMGAKVTVPMEGLGIGKQLQWLKEHTEV